jgi:hypothetical protein
MLRAFVPVVCLLLAGCPSAPPDPTPSASVWTMQGTEAPTRAAVVTETSTVRAPANPEGGRLIRGAEPVAAAGLPEGTITWLGGDDEVLLAHVHGQGIARSTDGGASFSAPTAPPALPAAFTSLLNPRGRPVPFGLDRADDGRLWLATVGGLFRSDDLGDTWGTTPVASSGSLNVLFTDVATAGDDVWAVSQLADSMLPSNFTGLLTGTVFHSTDRGTTWSDRSDGLDMVAPMAVEVHDGAPCVGSMDRGVRCLQAGVWTPLGDPLDVVALDTASDGTLLAATASDGLRAWSGSAWSAGGTGPVVALGADQGIGRDGAVYAFRAGEAAPATTVEPGTVHVALSFHVNLSHSYRGDTNDDYGYGQDLRVLRRILEWLEEHPDAKADWDIENYFSLDGWLAVDGPDVTAAIAARVAAGRDDVRIMSWNNGALASETEEEFRESIRRARASYDAVFAEQVPGVQPQENMFTPEHIAWYRSLGVDWITLFYSATGFTALRNYVHIEGADLYNPVTLRDPATDATMTWMPVYHHADVLDHGGIAGWARQLRRTVNGDSLLAIHFDGDAESWENFDQELDALQPLLESGEVVYSTIQEYLDTHEPVSRVDVVGDIADGTGDGFQSWAEKDFNHRLFTRILEAREWADRAELLGGGDAGVQTALDDALEPRLIALSTTHFGLAAPYLANDRVTAAWMYADAAVQGSLDAWQLAQTSAPVPAGTIELVNPRSSAGPALVQFSLVVPNSRFDGVDSVAISRDGVELPAEVTLASDDGTSTTLDVGLVVDTAAASVTTLTYTTDATGDRVSGGLTAADLPAEVPLRSPFTECGGALETGESSGSDEESVSPRALRVTRAELLDLPLCGATGLLRREHQRWAGLPGTVLVVDGTLPLPTRPDDAESVALTPVACSGAAETISWRTFGGTWQTRPVLWGVDTWNGQSIDGSARLTCADGVRIDLSHRVLERSSMAFLPFRDRGGAAMVAPLGTLWGSDPFHDGRRTGGSGVGEVVSAFVGSQVRPAAPDWGGRQVQYSLLIGEDLDADLLDLFAHPPAVRTGPVP